MTRRGLFGALAGLSAAPAAAASADGDLLERRRFTTEEIAQTVAFFTHPIPDCIAPRRRRLEREERLLALGFEDPTMEQRKEHLAKNMALKEWPKR